MNRALSILKPAPLIIIFCSIPPRPQIVNKTKIGVNLLAYHIIFICEGAKKFKRRNYYDKCSFSAKDIYKRTHEIAAFYEWVNIHDKIIAQAEHYIIIAQKHLVREELLIPSL